MLLFLGPLITVSHLHHRTPRICLVETTPFNSTNHTFVEALCYNTFCCSDGCCPWYLNIFVVLGIIFLFLFSWNFIEKRWYKHCHNANEAGGLNTDSQENVLMCLNQSTDLCGGNHQGYGSNYTYLNPQVNREERPPTYEQAVAIK